MGQQLKAYRSLQLGADAWTGPIGGKPDVYNYDTAQKYVIGTRFAMDERVFRYVKFGDDDGDAVTWTAGGGRQLEAGILMAATTLNVTADSFVGVSGSRTIAVTDTDTSLWTVDAFEGGYFLYAGSYMWSCRILGNTATSGNVSTVTLETPLPLTLTGLYASCRFMRSPWMGVVRHDGAGGSVFHSMVGVQVIYGTESAESEDKYGWIQTWGPVCIQISTSHKGGTTGERTLWAGTSSAQVETSQTEAQIIGFYMQETSSSNNLSQPMVFLQISP